MTCDVAAGPCCSRVTTPHGRAQCLFKAVGWRRLGALAGRLWDPILRVRSRAGAGPARALRCRRLASEVQQQREGFANLAESDWTDIAGALTNACRGHGTHVLALRRRTR